MTPFLIISSPYLCFTPDVTLFFNKVSNFSISLDLRSINDLLYSLFKTSTCCFEIFFESLSLFCLVNNLLSTTTPLRDGGAFNEASLTSPALSPNIALNNLSSGVGSLSPLGVILPIKISPSLTFAPTLTIPFSSKSFIASSLTLGISAVNSSSPLLVSLTSNLYSTICREVKISSLTTFSEITIASSKLYPCHGIKATLRFLPSANSPFCVPNPSQITCPFLTLSPTLTIGIRLTHVSWFVLLNFINSYVLEFSSKETNF